MRIKTFCTLPNKKDDFWQVVLLPSIAIFKSVDKYDPYTSVTGEWLFWSFSILIK